MNVPKGLFILWAICLVGIVVGFGLSADASTIESHNFWKWVAIGCCIVTGLGFGWLFVNSNRK